MGERMKKIIIIFITIILVVLFAIFFLTSSNDRYLNNMKKEINKNYEIKDEIKYLNKSNLYYIIVTNQKLIVLDNEYQEIFMEEVSKIKKINKDYEIVYRLNSVMYEVKDVYDDKIIYYYYDIYNGELLDTVEIGG